MNLREKLRIHVAYIVAMIIGFGLCVFLIVALHKARVDEHKNYMQMEAARAVCREWADKLDVQITEQGTYKKWERETLPVKDPWGRPVRVEYMKDRTTLKDLLKVWSAGPDGKPNTKDDIVEQRRVPAIKETMWER